MAKKVATTVYLTEDQLQLLKELNTRSRVPVAEFIRQGVDLILDQYKEILPGQIALPFGSAESKGSAVVGAEMQLQPDS